MITYQCPKCKIVDLSMNKEVFKVDVLDKGSYAIRNIYCKCGNINTVKIYPSI